MSQGLTAKTLPTSEIESFPRAVVKRRLGDVFLKKTVYRGEILYTVIITYC